MRRIGYNNNTNNNNNDYYYYYYYYYFKAWRNFSHFGGCEWGQNYVVVVVECWGEVGYAG